MRNKYISTQYNVRSHFNKHKIMKKVFLILFLFAIHFCYANGHEPLTVMAISGVNLRENPGLDGKILKKLPYGAIIYSDAYLRPDLMNKRFKADTIDGVSGFWIIAKYKKLKGYVFSPYLYNFYNRIKIDTTVNENTVKITHEGLCQGEVDFHPDLIWYGLYQDSSVFYIKKIEVKMHLSNVEGFKIFKGLDCVEEESIFLKTNVNQKSLFIIGVGKEWKEGTLFHSIFNKEHGYSKDNGFLYPEQMVNVYYNKHTYYLRAYDSISTDSECNIKKAYQLELIDRYFFENTRKQVKVNLSKSLNLRRSGKMHSEYKTPQIYWAGDINMDGSLDLIIYQHSMVGHGGVMWSYSLFLSDKSSIENPISIVDAAIRYSCH